MLVVEASGLGRVFKSPVKAGGLGASVRQLFRPEFKVFDAVKDVSFGIEPGELVGFLGFMARIQVVEKEVQVGHEQEQPLICLQS